MKHVFKQLRRYTLVTLAVLAGASGHAQELIVNGGFPGTPGGNFVPAPWVKTTGTPDLSNILTPPTPTGNPFIWLGTPVASPDGGNFESTFNDFNFSEAFTQTITGLVVGQTYRFSYYWASTPIRQTAPTTSDLNTLRASRVDFTGFSTPSFTSPLATAHWQWLQQVVCLTATATTATIQLGSQPSGTGISNGYLSIDGVSLTPSLAFTTQPANQTICPNGSVNFTATASGATGYSWEYSPDGGVNWGSAAANYSDGNGSWSGGTTNTLTVTTTGVWTNFRFRVVATGAAGCPNTSNAATMTVSSPPTIATQPANQTVCVNGTTSFTVTPSGAGPFTYQWQYSADNGVGWNNGGDGTYPPDGSYSGTATQTLTINPTNTAWNGFLWRAIVTSGGCSTASNGAVSTVNVCTTCAPAAGTITIP